MSTNAVVNEPSKISYFYGPGFSDIKEVIDQTRQKIAQSVDDITARSASKVNPGDGISSKFIRPLAVILWQIAAFSYWLFSAGSMAIASVFFCLFMLLPHVIGFLVFDFFGLISSQLARAVDLVYFKIRRISNVCDICHSRFTIPVYSCSSCGAKHVSLIPGKYGILHQTCTCGQKLPCSIFDRKSPRSNLQATCPFCYKAGRETLIKASDSRTICIPVVGGASSGKTAFITAYSTSIIEQVAPSRGLNTRFYDTEREQMYVKIKSAFKTGQVEKTAVATSRDASSAISFGFYVEGQDLKPSRLVELLDIAGESFVDNSENEFQNQYAHCEGIVLVVDPLAIRNVAALCSDQLDSGDKGSISDAHLEDVITALQNNLSKTTNTDRSGRVLTPLAIVINKVDASPFLDQRIGNTAATKVMASDSELFGNPLDTQDYLCRQFLLDMDMGDVVDTVQQQFVHSRFFVVSSIGHTAGNGDEFQPKNVNAVIDWILSMSDGGLNKALGGVAFSNAKLPIKAPVIGALDQLLDFQSTPVGSNPSSSSTMPSASRTAPGYAPNGGQAQPVDRGQSGQSASQTESDASESESQSAASNPQQNTSEPTVQPPQRAEKSDTPQADEESVPPANSNTTSSAADASEPFRSQKTTTADEEISPNGEQSVQGRSENENRPSKTSPWVPHRPQARPKQS